MEFLVYVNLSKGGYVAKTKKKSSKKVAKKVVSKSSAKKTAKKKTSVLKKKTAKKVVKKVAKKVVKKAVKKAPKKSLKPAVKKTQPVAKSITKKLEAKKALSEEKLVKKAKEQMSTNIMTSTGKLTGANYNSEVDPNNLKVAEKKLWQKWQALLRRNKSKEVVRYNMSEEYEVKTPIFHKTLGWGYVISNRNDRLEVLFDVGVRQLISNYKR